MEINVTSQKLRAQKCIFNGSEEHAIDLEVLLPDYCPDICRVLRCCCEIGITSREASGTSLEIEGVADISIIYADENGEIFGYNVSEPLTHHVTLPQYEGELHIKVVPSVEYINCRVQNSRRLDVHGMAALKITVCVDEENEVITAADGGGIQLLTVSREVEEPVCENCRYLSLNEELELPSSSSPVRSILRREVTVVNDECRIVGGKAVVKGELSVKMLYSVPSSQMPESFTDTVPFSQVIDLSGADEDCECEARFEICSVELRPRTGADGECHSVSFGARIFIEVTAKKRAETEIAVDAYCTKCELAVEKGKMSAGKSGRKIVKSDTRKEHIDLPDGVSGIIDLWSESVYCGSDNNDTGCSVSGGFTLCLLCTDKAGDAAVYERPIQFSLCLDEDMNGCNICDCSACISSLSYTLTDAGSAEIRAGIEVTLCLGESKDQTVITSLTAGETKKAPEASLIICYASKGDRVWDIARRYNTTADAVSAANDLTDLILADNTMLLIPVIQ